MLCAGGMASPSTLPSRSLRRLLWGYVCSELPAVEHESARTLLGSSVVQANEELFQECLALGEILQDMAVPDMSPPAKASAGILGEEVGRVWLEKELQALVSQLENACCVGQSLQSNDRKTLESIYCSVTEGGNARHMVQYLRGLKSGPEEEKDKGPSQRERPANGKGVIAIEAFVREWARHQGGLDAAALGSSDIVASARIALSREGEELKEEVTKLHRLIEAGYTFHGEKVEPPTTQALREFKSNILSGIEKAKLVRQLACPESCRVNPEAKVSTGRQQKSTGYVRR